MQDVSLHRHHQKTLLGMCEIIWCTLAHRSSRKVDKGLALYALHPIPTTQPIYHSKKAWDFSERKKEQRCNIETACIVAKITPSYTLTYWELCSLKNIKERKNIKYWPKNSPDLYELWLNPINSNEEPVNLIWTHLLSGKQTKNNFISPEIAALKYKIGIISISGLSVDL